MKENFSSCNVLVVEDNPGDFVLIEEYLRAHFATPVILGAQSYKNATKILSERADQIEVILLDLTLPDKTGIPLITDMLSLSTGIPHYCTHRLCRF
ncbi:hypothetical protein CJD36_012250 [Flavipsychrobacter stenotrophus]|uniref:Response regulatory domain-containing protein n=1 Tax=Flavipsychrobacter stenotrophus TaxID=2077091 RepID=A0A2S7SVW3_9BACT|nr:response regulator [Flavipsychrobacter stenotrophus]PQJ10735.1 hypothetical protein CJD36_012250 [Flavipsychrobacter stenotrophus]